MLGRLLLTGLQAATLGARGTMALRGALAPRRGPVPAEGPLSVLFLAHYPTRYTGSKYRLAKWAERLRALGHRAELVPTMPDRHAERFSNDWRRSARAEYHLRLLAARTKAVLGAGKFDVAVIHMNDLPFWEYGSPFVAKSLKRIVGRVLLDLDDLPVVAGEDRVRPRVTALASAVDGYIVGNRRLLDYLPPKPAWFVPTCVDPAEWPAAGTAARTGPPILGWVGTVGNLDNLVPLAPVLAEACRRHGATVRIVCSHPAEMPGVPMEFVKWTAEREVEDLLPMDVGLAPLNEGVMRRCKCAFKSIQYMAAGLPVITSPVGANADVVEDGVTGFHATDPAAWAKALDALLSDPALRARMGAAGRAAVDGKWSLGAHERTFVDALRGVGGLAGTGGRAS